MVQPAHGLCWQFWSYGQQLFDESTYLQVDHKIVFPPSGCNSTQQLDAVELNILTEISGSLWWEIWLKELEKAKIAPPTDWLEDQVWPHQMLRDSRAAVTGTGQRNHPPNSAAIFALLVTREKAQCLSAPNVTWACAWSLVSRNVVNL